MFYKKKVQNEWTTNNSEVGRGDNNVSTKDGLDDRRLSEKEKEECGDGRLRN